MAVKATKCCLHNAKVQASSPGGGAPRVPSDHRHRRGIVIAVGAVAVVEERAVVRLRRHGHQRSLYSTEPANRLGGGGSARPAVPRRKRR